MYDIFVKTNLVIDHSMLWTGCMVAQHELTAAINSMVAGYVGSGTQTNNIDLCYSLQWRHNERDVVPNHRCLDCLLNPFFRRTSKKTSKFRVTGFCEVNSPQKGTVTRKMFRFDDVIMYSGQNL